VLVVVRCVESVLENKEDSSDAGGWGIVIRSEKVRLDSACV